MNQPLATILQALDFMEDHLRDEITIADIASAANYSLFHFVRTFNRFIQHTPYDYLIRRRLSQAALELVHTRRKIITLALDYKFHSTEVFARAFKRMFGLQPSEYRARQRVDKRFLLAQRTSAHLALLQQQGFLPPIQEEWQTCRLAGLMIRHSNQPEEQLELWNCLRQALAGENLPHPPRAFYGITFYPQGWEGGGPFYLAAVDLPDIQPAYTTLITYLLPSGTYACFQHIAKTASLPEARDCIYQTWLPHSGWQLAHPIDIEFYGPVLPTDRQSVHEPGLYLPIRQA